MANTKSTKPSSKSKSSKTKTTKKEFDKDYIFNLIMPSSSEPLPEDEFEPEPIPEPEETAINDNLSRLKEKINQTSISINPSLQMKPPKDLILVNLMEHLVAERIDEVFEKFNCCHCDKCKKDVAAKALNMLTPNYVVIEPDNLTTAIASCSAKEVSVALVKAVIQVKANPQH